MSLQFKRNKKDISSTKGSNNLLLILCGQNLVNQRHDPDTSHFYQ